MTTDAEQRKQWRGKVRVFARSNANGETQYSAQYRLNWLLSFDWLNVPAEEGSHMRGYYAKYIFPTAEAAKVAAQLRWNQDSEAYRASLKKRFSAWRKVWP